MATNNQTGAFFSGVLDTVTDPIKYAEALAQYGMGNHDTSAKIMREGTSFLPDWFNSYRNQLRQEYPGTAMAGSIAGGGLAGAKSVKYIFNPDLNKIQLFREVPTDIIANKYMPKAILGGAGTASIGDIADRNINNR